MTEADIVIRAAVQEYTDFSTERGDYGVVAEGIGAAWAVFTRGKGYVADDVPELVVNVDAAHRGRGVGSALIAHILDHGRQQHWRGISLHVERTNPAARRLFARHNFVAQNNAGTMLAMLNPTINAVAVYCGSAMGTNPAFAHAARELGAELARRGMRLVYGGSKVGLMGEVANACLDAGGEVTGVMPISLADLELAHPGLTTLETVDSMSRRKLRMEELAHAYIALPGGMGTLEELFQVLVRQQLGPYTGPLALYNVDGFWDPMVKTLHSMAECGFIPQRYVDAIVVADSTDALFEAFSTWENPGLKWRD